MVSRRREPFGIAEEVHEEERQDEREKRRDLPAKKREQQRERRRAADQAVAFGCESQRVSDSGCLSIGARDGGQGCAYASRPASRRGGERRDVRSPRSATTLLEPERVRVATNRAA